jgi:hypothetical protein
MNGREGNLRGGDGLPTLSGQPVRSSGTAQYLQKKKSTNYHHFPHQIGERCLSPPAKKGEGAAGVSSGARTGRLADLGLWKAYGPVDDADAKEEAGGAEQGRAPRGHARRLVRSRRRHHRASATSDASPRSNGEGWERERVGRALPCLLLLQDCNACCRPTRSLVLLGLGPQHIPPV